MAVSLKQVKGIGPFTAEKLVDAGFATVEDLAAAGAEQLVSLPGFGKARATQVIEQAKQLAGIDPFTDREATLTRAVAESEREKKNATGKVEKKSQKKSDKKKEQNPKKKKANKKEKNKKEKKKKKKKSKGGGKSKR